ncbi:hypothetical protein J6590_097732, partial [Homalodisca vitripennis]
CKFDRSHYFPCATLTKTDGSRKLREAIIADPVEGTIQEILTQSQFGSRRRLIKLGSVEQRLLQTTIFLQTMMLVQSTSSFSHFPAVQCYTGARHLIRCRVFISSPRYRYTTK